MWGARPSALLGLDPGSVEAFLVDRDLAQLLHDEEQRQGQEGDAGPVGGVEAPGVAHPGSPPPPDGVPWSRNLGGV